MSRYLCNDISRFSEIVTPAYTGASQEVLDETHSNIVTPSKTKETVKFKNKNNHLFINGTPYLYSN